jgi:hypothetical protein
MLKINAQYRNHLQEGCNNSKKLYPNNQRNIFLSIYT